MSLREYINETEHDVLLSASHLGPALGEVGTGVDELVLGAHVHRRHVSTRIRSLPERYLRLSSRLVGEMCPLEVLAMYGTRISGSLFFALIACFSSEPSLEQSVESLVLRRYSSSPPALRMHLRALLVTNSLNLRPRVSLLNHLETTPGFFMRSVLSSDVTSVYVFLLFKRKGDVEAALVLEAVEEATLGLASVAYRAR